MGLLMNKEYNSGWTYVAKDNNAKYCPVSKNNIKNKHPRVVLKFYNSIAYCPYCGEKYKKK